MKRMLALILALTMVMALVACGGDKPTSSTPSSTPDKSAATSTPTEPSKPADSGKPTEPEKPTEPAKPAEPKILKSYTKSEGFTLNVHASGSTYDADIIDRILIGLYDYLPEDGRAVLSPILADGRPVDVNGDGKTWNIKISKDAKWANGDPINADTFLYSWKECMDPVMYYTNGKGFASGRVTIVNAVEYYNQKQEGAKAVAWEDVGIKKIDGQTIQIQTTTAVNDQAVMTHLQIKSAKPVYEPIYSKCKAADGLSNTYGADMASFMGNGPFNLTTWIYEALHEYEKNPNYIKADLVKIDKIIEPIVKDDNTINQMFENGEIYSMTVNSTNEEKYGEDPRMVVYPSRTTSTLEVNTANTSNPILANYNFRMAMYWGFDREGSCKLYNYRPHLSTIPNTAGCTAMADGTLYKEVALANNIYPGQETFGYDPVKAKQYFDKALQETGLNHVEVSFLVTENYSKCAVYLQELWPKIFGEDKIKVIVDVQTTGVINERRGAWATNPTTEGSYDVAFLGLAPSASDYCPASGSSYYNTNRAARNAPHENEKAAELYLQAGAAVNDPEECYRLTMEYEKALQETMTAIPWAYSISKVIRDDCYVLPVDVENYAVAGGWCSNYADIIQ